MVVGATSGRVRGSDAIWPSGLRSGSNVEGLVFRSAVLGLRSEVFWSWVEVCYRPPLRDGQKIEREAHETRARKHARARRAFWCVLGSCHDPRFATGCFPVEGRVFGLWSLGLRTPASRRAASPGGVLPSRCATPKTATRRCPIKRREGASRRRILHVEKAASRPAVALASRAASVGRVGAISGRVSATFWTAGRGARRSCFAKSGVARVPRSVFFDTPKKRRPAIALRNMSHSQIVVQNTSPCVFVQSTRNRPKSRL